MSEAWDEYAALTRHLGEVRRSTAEQRSTASQQRAAAEERAARLDGRLAAQRDRLSRFAALTGASQRDLLAPVTPAVDALLRPPPTAETAPGGAATAVPAAPQHPAIATTAYPVPPMPGSADTAPAPTSPADQHTAHVPAQRTGPPPVLAIPVPDPQVSGDPGALLDAADRFADAADVAVAQAEAASLRPALLPRATPLSRSLAAYAACAGLALVVQMGLVLLAGNSGGYSWSVGAWMCTGLPALAFFAGFGALTVWGRPAVDDGRPVQRNPRVGFAICFLALPIALCGYFALVQLIRR